MRFAMNVQDNDDKNALEALKETITAIQSVSVWPYPRLLQDALCSRGVDVDMTLEEDEEHTTMRVTRKK